MSNEVIFYDENKQFMFTPAREAKPDTHMLVVPEGFTERFRKAYKEWMECQNLVNILLTGQDLDHDFNS